MKRTGYLSITDFLNTLFDQNGSLFDINSFDVGINFGKGMEIKVLTHLFIQA